MRKEKLFIVLIILFSSLGTCYVINNIPIQTKALLGERLFIAELIGINFILPGWVIIISSLINILLIYYLGKKMANFAVAIVCAALYGLSPWIIYYSAAGSVFVLLLTSLVVTFCGFIKINEKLSFLNVLLYTIGLLSLLFISIYGLLLVPIYVWLLLNQKTIKFKFIVASLCLLLVLLPIIFLILRNPPGFNNIAHQQISIFNNIGLINNVNVLQGENKKAGYNILGRVTENKYTYFGQHLLFNLLKHLVPVTYFTSQEKMLHFSFTPPIFIGLIIPLLLGINAFVKILTKYKIAYLILLMLLMPSVLYGSSPDLSRLTIFAPVIFYIISLGFEYLNGFPARKKKILVGLILSLILFQAIITIADISVRESIRLNMLSNH